MLFFGVYLTMIIAWAFTFYLTIGGEQFTNWVGSIVKVIAMMIGEVEYSDTFAWDTWQHSFVINILFVFFVFIVPVVINNLIIGLTVSDTNEVLKEAETHSLKKKMADIIEFELVFLKNTLLGKMFSKLNNAHLLCENELKETHEVIKYINLKCILNFAFF